MDQETGAALVQALLYGKLDGLSQEMIFLFSRTGLIHLFSASGFHMTAALHLAQIPILIFGNLLTVQKKLWLSFLLSFALMLFFGNVTDWSSPMVRAFAFAFLLSAAKIWQKRPSLSWVFLLSLVVAAVLGKGSALSFCLSAAGMAGILFLGAKNLFSLSLCPWITTLPIVVWHFHIFSLSAPMWNLTLGVALSFTVLPMAILQLLISSLGLDFTFFGRWSAYFMEWAVHILKKGDAWLGGSHWVDPRLFFLLLFLCLPGFWLMKKSMKWGTMVFLGIFLLGIFFPKPYLAVLDVGQGDGIYFETATERILVDAGPSAKKMWPSPVARELEKNGIGEIDHFLLTHPDSDHMGGAESLLLRHQLKQNLWLRESHITDLRLLPLLEAAERGSSAIKFLSDSKSPPGIRCWLPPVDGGNDSSPFCHATLANGYGLWLTGDTGVKSEQWLLQTKDPLPKSHFLKVGHHGSKTSSSGEFLRAVGGSIALLSLRKRNPYGHPHGEVLDRLTAEGYQIHRTDQDGSLRFFRSPISWVKIF